MALSVAKADALSMEASTRNIFRARRETSIGFLLMV